MTAHRSNVDDGVAICGSGQVRGASTMGVLTVCECKEGGV